MLNLMFIRHAQTELNKEGIFAGRTDCSITKEAFEEAREVFRDIEKNFDYIYCSPLKRTKQTLDAILPNSMPIIDERIIEISIGEWEGKKKAAFDKNLLALYRAGQYTPPGAETTSQVDRRVCEFIESLFDKYKNNERILIITHNGVMRSIKRNFVKEYDDIMSKNLGHILLTDENYQYYLEKIKDKEDTR
ncbi:MAG: histidine phosphatase family protein [Clostridia bacterium]|nr:histidine phosphatase family protein [Clostridia bacterium]